MRKLQRDSSLINIISPCVRNCCLNDENVCLGCFRSIDEIIQWSDATEQQKQKIINLANARKIDHRLKYRSYIDSGHDSNEDQLLRKGP
ncbi:MAG: DUF1289 domain-containing protein [Methylobacter sp.]|uniref:DUF1289 domain-containing protein n=1 Tax=Methylobacter sp. TaxID=2051955 RepID=UPI00271B178C|nr:DUF1289 domain-containing protein [Methylobacter sp.]MDO9270007.1 DUF1289 domain-containing protein [Methylobacter sp.]MDP1663929.1 DUF1289 domain-containing protein [Methylobacter sp.]